MDEVVGEVAAAAEEDGTNFDEDLAAILAAAEKEEEQALNAVVTKDVEEKQDDNNNGPDDVAATGAKYKLRTIRPGSISSQQRTEILPAYSQAANGNHHRTPILLLSNVAIVDRGTYEKQSFCGGNGVTPYEFRQYGYVEPIDSFMIDLYRDLFIEPSRRWKIDHSIIDYNLSRLRKCMDLYTKQTNEPALLSFNELTLALEFFLQIDGKRHMKQ
jgi:hypothetical protein